MTKALFKALAISLILITGVNAGSYFSSKTNGLGLRNYTTGVRGLGMGYTGIASNDSVQLSSIAFTQWRYIKTTRVTIGMQYQSSSLDLADAGTSGNSSADFGALNIAVPILKNRWVFGLSVTPYSEVDFKSRQDLVSDNVNFTQITNFTGTVSRAQFALVWAPVPSVGLSANYTYYFGTLNDQYDFRFEDDGYRDTSHKVAYRFTGPGFGFGADWQVASGLRIAGFVDFKPSIKLDVSYESTLTPTEEKVRNFSSFPMQFGFGSQWKLNDRWLVAADFSQQDWKKALKSPSDEYDTWQLLSVGFERRAKTERKAGFFNGKDWRGGFSATKLGYKFNGNTVNEYALHLGVGIPFGYSANRVDAAVVGGFRGDLDKNLAKEQFVKFQLSISIGEQWFQDRR